MAGIHYYRREFVPKSTPSLSLFLSRLPLFYKTEKWNIFFFFFLVKLRRLGHILWSLHAHRERKVMKKPLGCSHTQAKVCFLSRSGKMYNSRPKLYLIAPWTAPNQPRRAPLTLKLGNFRSQLLIDLFDCA